MFVVTCNGSLAVAQKCFGGRSSVKRVMAHLHKSKFKVDCLVNKNTKIPKLCCCVHLLRIGQSTKIPVCTIRLLRIL